MWLKETGRERKKQAFKTSITVHKTLESIYAQMQHADRER